MLMLTQSLMQHYHHSVAVEAKKLEQPLPKLESDLAAQLDNNVDDVRICVRTRTIRTLQYMAVIVLANLVLAKC